MDKNDVKNIIDENMDAVSQPEQTEPEEKRLEPAHPPQGFHSPGIKSTGLP